MKKRNGATALLETGGALFLLLSVLSSNSILALIGLTLVFWGILFLFIAPGRYVKKELLEASFSGPMEALEEVLSSAAEKGRATYLPPRSLQELGGEKVYFSAKGEKPLTDSKTLALQGTGFQPGGRGVLVTAPGVGVLRILQDRLGVDFVGADIGYLQAALPRVLSEDLELVRDADIQIAGDEVVVKTVGRAFSEICSKTCVPGVDEAYLACPLHSAFALAFAKASGRPVQIESVIRAEDGMTVTAKYDLLGA